jgi:hypothetical protein
MTSKLKDFAMFSESRNRGRMGETSRFNRYLDLERRVEDRFDEWKPEPDSWASSNPGAISRFQAMAENPSGAGGRLLLRGLSLVQKIGKSIVDLFKIPFSGSGSLKDIESERPEYLEKWGNSIMKSGRNKKEDYEDFYEQAYVNGKKTFGKFFDLDFPDSEEAKVYSDYVRGARRFYDF